MTGVQTCALPIYFYFLFPSHDIEVVKDTVMMLAHGGYRVALATTHIPLSQVAQSVTLDLMERKIKILAQDLSRWFGISGPRIAICGLNPHAGESGHIGREEIEIIQPGIERLNAEGYKLIGPLSADTVLMQRHATAYDAVFAWYHDQGLGPIKALYFDTAVNITLGLPIFRSSVDHGTALDLAGTGKACSNNFRSAIAAAC